MHIVKFLDKILTKEEAGQYNLTEDQVDLFNTKFKAKYTHCINGTFCICLEDLSIEDVVDLSQKLTTSTSAEEIAELVQKYDYLIYPDILGLLDTVENEKINSLTKYVTFNKFVPDADITIDDLKNFRSWFASQTLILLPDIDDDTKHMLQYYSQHMSDDVTKYLGVFGKTTLSLQTTSSASSCGCGQVSQSVVASTVGSSQCGCGNGNLSSLYLQKLGDCNPVFIYQKNIYLKMVETFSKIDDFWLKLPVEFIKEVQKYITNIIKQQINFDQRSYIKDYVECGCLGEADEVFNRQKNRLNNFNNALTYIIGELDSDTTTPGLTGKRREVGDAIDTWATYVYETMEVSTSVVK